jgi:hypothetical protein
MRPWDRLTGPEKAALVRQWNRYATLLIKQAATARSFEQHSPTPLWGSTLTSATLAASLVVDLAKARESYLRGLRDTWFRLTFGTRLQGQDRVPEYLFEHQAVLDGILWEQHPSNLLDDMAEQAAKEITK